jgi:hypothetical protein
MLLKKTLATLFFLGLCIASTQMWAEMGPVGVILLSMVAGVIALLLYDGKNFLSGAWDLAKTGILTAVLVLGFLCLLLYIFCAQDRSVPNRT